MNEAVNAADVLSDTWLSSDEAIRWVRMDDMNQRLKGADRD